MPVHNPTLEWTSEERSLLAKPRQSALWRIALSHRKRHLCQSRPQCPRKTLWRLKHRYFARSQVPTRVQREHLRWRFAQSSCQMEAHRKHRTGMESPKPAVLQLKRRHRLYNQHFQLCVGLLRLVGRFTQSAISWATSTVPSVMSR